MLTPQYLLDIAHELIVDLFAGGGGMSTAIEQAIGRHVNISANHNDDAVSMHRANHPQTRHFCADVFEVDPRGACHGRPVGLLHLSPDCTHHSQAAGGQPRDRKIRALPGSVRFPRKKKSTVVPPIARPGLAAAKSCNGTTMK